MGATCVFGEDPNCSSAPNFDGCNPQQSLQTYGRLYNWYAVNDPRGLCPNGWRVPADEDWGVMIEHLGGQWGAGQMLKATFGWFSDENGTNSSGFTGLPGGRRTHIGTEADAGYSGFWWTASEIDEQFASWRGLFFDDSQVYINDAAKGYGQSVRCIQDTE